jgi:hypothetical protein
VGLKSINEPDGPGRLTMAFPVSINEPPDDLIDEINPPRVTGVDPNPIAISDPPLTLQVHGMYLTHETLIVFDGVRVETTWISDVDLTAELDPSACEPRGYPVTVALGDYVAQPATMLTVQDAAQDDFQPTHAPRRKTRR